MRFSTAFRQIGHSDIRSPHIWHVPWPQRKIMLRKRSIQTGHIVCQNRIHDVITDWRQNRDWFENKISYLFFDILKLLLELLNVRITVVPASVVHQRPFLRSGASWTASLGADRATTAGRKGHLVVQTTADNVRNDAIDLRPTLNAFLHESRTAITGAHVTARPEQHRRLLVRADNTLFNLSSVVCEQLCPR